MVEPYLNQVGGKVNDDVSLFTGGLNAYTDKAFLESNQLPFVINMTIENPPELKTRKGRTTLAEYMASNKWQSNIGTPIDIWTYNEFQFYVIVDNNGTRSVVEIYRPASGGYYSSNYVVRNLGTIPKEDRYYFALAKQGVSDWLYITGLTFKAKVIIDNNPLLTQLISVGDNHYGICCCHKGRLFLGMPDSNIVTFSALYDYDNFDELVQYQVVTNPLEMVDENIVYLMQNAVINGVWDKYAWDEQQAAFIQDGTIAKTELVIDTTTGLSMPDYSVIAGDFKITNSIGKLVSLKSFDDKLMIFCEHSMHTVYGSTPDETLSDHFQLVDLNNNLGAVSDRCIAIGGGRMFWIGDNQEVYEYTGSSLNIVSRPSSTRYSVISQGGISGLIKTRDLFEGSVVDYGGSTSKMIATSEKLYINTWNARRAGEKLLFVFDIFSRTWWCEDGAFNTIGNFSFERNEILLAPRNGDILRSTSTYTPADVNNFNMVDEYYDFDTDTIDQRSVEYEFHTRVYGADGVDLRKTLNDVWFQARANADVYINDIWTSLDRWSGIITTDANLVKIGTLVHAYQSPSQVRYYRSETYEQQVCYVEKMYGQRLNAFQIVVKGKGDSKFYLMKREWRAR